MGMWIAVQLTEPGIKCAVVITLSADMWWEEVCMEINRHGGVFLKTRRF